MNIHTQTNNKTAQQNDKFWWIFIRLSVTTFHLNKSDFSIWFRLLFLFGSVVSIVNEMQKENINIRAQKTECLQSVLYCEIFSVYINETERMENIVSRAGRTHTNERSGKIHMDAMVLVARTAYIVRVKRDWVYYMHSIHNTRTHAHVFHILCAIHLACTLEVKRIRVVDRMTEKANGGWVCRIARNGKYLLAQTATYFQRPFERPHPFYCSALCLCVLTFFIVRRKRWWAIVGNVRLQGMPILDSICISKLLNLEQSYCCITRSQTIAYPASRVTEMELLLKMQFVWWKFRVLAVG